MNSFEKLYNKKILQAGNIEESTDKIKHRIDESRNFLSFAGDMLDLYIPKVFDYVVKSLESENEPLKKN